MLPFLLLWIFLAQPNLFISSLDTFVVNYVRTILLILFPLSLFLFFCSLFYINKIPPSTHFSPLAFKHIISPKTQKPLKPISASSFNFIYLFSFIAKISIFIWTNSKQALCRMMSPKLLLSNY